MWIFKSTHHILCYNYRIISFRGEFLLIRYNRALYSIHRLVDLEADFISVLALGLSFAITPKNFPLLEYIAATENLCQALEEYADDEYVEKAQSIRNITINL